MFATPPAGRAAVGRWRRGLFLSLVPITSVAGVATLAAALAENGFGVVDGVVLTLFAISFFWIAFLFWTGLIGFLVRVLCADPVGFAVPVARRRAAALAVDVRIAVVMPVYNEDVGRAFAGLLATCRSVARSGHAAGFDFFLLSDSTDPALIRDERRRCRAARRENLFGGRLRYVSRGDNSGGKAGNIDAFCRRFGDRYRYMAVLDADSVMSGDALLRLALILEGNPAVGIVQAARRVANQHTPFARLLQFGLRTTSELFTLGQCFWQGPHGAYSGHNAMIRLAPFSAHCGLPVLSGDGPLGGRILSHDFVESALMCRAGYEVWNLPDGDGSFEELPTNLVDYAARDRRWCQGNLQHLRLLMLPGLPLACRLQLLSGALAYLSSAVWLLLLTVGLLLALYGGVAGGVDWDAARPARLGPLLVATVVMLLLPKLLATALLLARPDARGGYGGGRSLLYSAALEMPLAALLAPVLMLHHTGVIVAILAGRSTRWNAQPRDSRALGGGEALRRHRWHVLLGALLCGCIALLAPRQPLVWWFAPIALGLLLAVPLAVLSSRAGLGRRLRRGGLFVTPEEVAPPQELAHLGVDQRTRLRAVA